MSNTNLLQLELSAQWQSSRSRSSKVVDFNNNRKRLWYIYM